MPDIHIGDCVAFMSVGPILRGHVAYITATSRWDSTPTLVTSGGAVAPDGVLGSAAQRDEMTGGEKEDSDGT